MNDDYIHHHHHYYHQFSQQKSLREEEKSLSERIECGGDVCLVREICLHNNGDHNFLGKKMTTMMMISVVVTTKITTEKPNSFNIQLETEKEQNFF